MSLTVLIAVAIALWIVRGLLSTGSSPAASVTPPAGVAGTNFADYGPLDSITQAWAQFEGWNKPGSLAQQNNNPVNIKGNWPGVVGHTPNGLAIFSDSSLGFAAAQSWIQRQAQEHPDWSLRQLFAKVLGSLNGEDVNNEQGNSVNEADYVASRLGVPDSTNFSSYIGGQ